MTRTSVLTIAGLDPSGGAGIAADLAAFAAFGCHGMAVVAVSTVQDTVQVVSAAAVPAALVGQQLDAVAADCPPRAVKCGLLGCAASVSAVERMGRRLRDVPLVIDPVSVSGSGARLSDDDTVRATVDRLFPIAALVTPNAIEAEELTGIAANDVAGAEAAARIILALGPAAVLVKGGHADGASCRDVLVERGRPGVRVYERPRIAVPRRVHGTGCTLSAAVTAALARGFALPDAVDVAGRYVHAAIAGAHATGAGALVLDFGVRVAGMPS